MSDPGMLTSVFVDPRLTSRRLRRSRLSVVSGANKGAELVIDRERVTIGRSVICDLVLADKAVSGTHCELVADEKGVLLRDLESTNGTSVGELRIREVWLRQGTLFTVGQTQIRFEPLEGSIDIAVSGNETFYDLAGTSMRMREIFAVLEKVAPSDLTVLVRGETGTGKELVARAIHRASKRAAQPLVVQDCSAIPRELVESTLFGH